jgi:hypothetical protein
MSRHHLALLFFGGFAMLLSLTSRADAGQPKGTSDRAPFAVKVVGSGRPMILIPANSRQPIDEAIEAGSPAHGRISNGAVTNSLAVQPPQQYPTQPVRRLGSTGPF